MCLFENVDILTMNCLISWTTVPVELESSIPKRRAYKNSEVWTFRYYESLLLSFTQQSDHQMTDGFESGR